MCVAGPATAGVKAKVDAKGGLSGIEACAEVQTAAVTVAAKYDVSKGGISGSLHTGVNDSTAVAVSMTAGGDLTLGANYTIDKDSNVKAKVKALRVSAQNCCVRCVCASCAVCTRCQDADGTRRARTRGDRWTRPGSFRYFTCRRSARTSRSRCRPLLTRRSSAAPTRISGGCRL